MAKNAANPKTGNPGTSEFNGGLLGLIGISILQVLLIVFTLTLGLAWAVCMKIRWYAKHTRVNGRQVEFDGKGIQLFGNCIKWFFLTIITLGIYSFWLGIKMEKWKMKHLFVKETSTFAAGQTTGYPMPPVQPMQPTQPTPQISQGAPYGYPTIPPAPYPYPYPQATMPYGYPVQEPNERK